MSSESFIAFFGLRYSITIVESENNDDERIRAARKVGLQYYAGNFGGLDEQYHLFIGQKLGVLGAENEKDIILSSTEVQAIMERTRERLRLAGLMEEPSLFLQWEPDV